MRFKKLICVLLSAVMLFAAVQVHAQEVKPVVVANATKVSGAFFTRQFGNNTSDIDVREMLHGYNPIVWDSQLNYLVDDNVVVDLTESTSADGKTYIFTIAQDLTWNDGTPITAADYAFAYALQLSKAFEKIGGDTDVWAHIAGYEDYVSGRKGYLSGVRLLSDYSFSVKVKASCLPYFYEYSYLYITPSPISVIAPGCKVCDDGKGVYITNADASVKETLFTAELLEKTILDENTGYLSNPKPTCGPYNLLSYDRESGTVEFVRNTYYKGAYGGIKPSIERITLIACQPQDMAAKLKKGEIDIINKAVDKDTIDSCMNVTGYSSVTYPRLGYGFISLACEKGPQQFQAVRQAIAYAFDQDTFVKKYLGSYGSPVYGFYGIGQWMTLTATNYAMTEDGETVDALSTLEHYDIDLEKAEQLLEKDGWTLNSAGKRYDKETDSLRYKKVRGKLMPLSFEFALCEGHEGAQLAYDLLAPNMEKLGAQLNVHKTTYSEILTDYLREEGERKYDMSFLAYNFNAVFDPMVELKQGGSQNAPGYYSRELTRLAEKMHFTQQGDTEKYLNRWIDFEKQFNKELPSIPIYSGNYYDFCSARVEGYHPDMLAHWPNAILYASVSE